MYRGTVYSYGNDQKIVNYLLPPKAFSMNLKQLNELTKNAMLVKEMQNRWGLCTDVIENRNVHIQHRNYSMKETPDPIHNKRPFK